MHTRFGLIQSVHSQDVEQKPNYDGISEWGGGGGGGYSKFISWIMDVLPCFFLPVDADRDVVFDFKLLPNGGNWQSKAVSELRSSNAMSV